MDELLPGLPSDIPQPFILLDAVTEWSPARLIGVRRFANAPAWQGLECMAQAAALHQRVLAGFSRHAFLLGCEECLFEGDSPLAGLARVTVTLTGQASGSALYAAELAPERGPALRARLAIGLAPYGERFDAATLTQAYKERFAWLTAGAPAPQ